jgi:hypothetical protein
VKRRLLNLLTGVSLLLCVAVVLLWVRSYWFADTLRWSGGKIYSLGSHNGLLVWNDFRPDPGNPALPWRQTYRGRDRGYDWDRLGRSAWNRAGFGFAVGYTAGNNRIRQVTVPHWFVTLAAALFSAPELRSVLRRRRRAKAGLCPSCGYDLTGNVSGLCPDRGRAAAPA